MKDQLQAYVQHKPECELAAVPPDYGDGQPRRISKVSGKPVPLSHWETWTHVASCTCGLEALLAVLPEQDPPKEKS